MLRFEIGPCFKYDLALGAKQPRATSRSPPNGVVVVRWTSRRRALADGTSVSFVEGAGGGFKITNPNQPASVKQMTVQELKAKLDGGAPLHLFDVRTQTRRSAEIAIIAGAIPFTPDALEALPKDTPISLPLPSRRSQPSRGRARARDEASTTNHRTCAAASTRGRRASTRRSRATGGAEARVSRPS